jgi:hypothetical protein
MPDASQEWVVPESCKYRIPLWIVLERMCFGYVYWFQPSDSYCAIISRVISTPPFTPPSRLVSITYPNLLRKRQRVFLLTDLLISFIEDVTPPCSIASCVVRRSRMVISGSCRFVAVLLHARPFFDFAGTWLPKLPARAGHVLLPRCGRLVL